MATGTLTRKKSISVRGQENLLENMRFDALMREAVEKSLGKLVEPRYPITRFDAEKNCLFLENKDGSRSYDFD